MSAPITWLDLAAYLIAAAIRTQEDTKTSLYLVSKAAECLESYRQNPRSKP